MRYVIETEREVDGRWLAEVTALPGVMAYGQTKAEAVATVKALALRVLADRIESNKKAVPSPSPFPWLAGERLAKPQGPPGLQGIAKNRLFSQASFGFPR